MNTATVVGRSVALGKVVGLNLLGLATEPLPVDLVEAVGLEDNAGNDTSTRGSNQLNLELSEEDVAETADGRGLLLIGDAEDSALGLVVGKSCTGSKAKERVLALGEVDGVVPTDGKISRTGYTS